MDDRIDVFGAFAEGSPEVQVVRAHRQLCHGGMVGDRSMLWVPLSRIGRVPHSCTQSTDQIVTSEAFLPYKQLWMGGTHSGHEVTNFHPICEGSNLVHEAIKSKSGATHSAASSAPSGLQLSPLQDLS